MKLFLNQASPNGRIIRVLLASADLIGGRRAGRGPAAFDVW